MTNGAITKQVLKAAKTETGEQLFNTACRAFRRFPLSSHKLLYDEDKSKVSPEAWEQLLKAAVKTDQEKLAATNQMLKESGLKPYKEFGRAEAEAGK